MTDEERKEIGRLIAEGYTSGRLDNEDDRHVAWNLSTEEWNDNEPSPTQKTIKEIREIVRNQ